LALAYASKCCENPNLINLFKQNILKMRKFQTILFFYQVNINIDIKLNKNPFMKEERDMILMTHYTHGTRWIFRAKLFQE